MDAAHLWKGSPPPQADLPGRQRKRCAWQDLAFLHDTVIQQVPCPLRARVDIHILRGFVTKQNCTILVAGTGSFCAVPCASNAVKRQLQGGSCRGVGLCVPKKERFRSLPRLGQPTAVLRCGAFFRSLSILMLPALSAGALRHWYPHFGAGSYLASPARITPRVTFLPS